MTIRPPDARDLLVTLEILKWTQDAPLTLNSLQRRHLALSARGRSRPLWLVRGPFVRPSLHRPKSQMLTSLMKSFGGPFIVFRCKKPRRFVNRVCRVKWSFHRVGTIAHINVHLSA